ncbi:hypothetical protein HMPREF0580_0201 [Mobiluncus mulieris ATCC 35239]|uniref:Uncharacterized protein n=1 Tax=Mobiluncus mulieris ATCC 35239 TaxID=871571 RepID=E0QMT7_9ACTO|nr:hypothetical protein HMPREF0580_0201 [Mobiluncus mulieris ATCC 35239]
MAKVDGASQPAKDFGYGRAGPLLRLFADLLNRPTLPPFTLLLV